MFGCGAPAPETQSQSQVVEPSAVTADDEFTGKVIKVVDGDTIDVLTNDEETIRIRLHGIDCPERGQPFSNNATQALKVSILGNVVKVVSHGQDRYDRTIGEIYHDGTQINRALVAAGTEDHTLHNEPDDAGKSKHKPGTEPVPQPACRRMKQHASQRKGAHHRFYLCIGEIQIFCDGRVSGRDTVPG